MTFAEFYAALGQTNRLRLEVPLKPAQGHRFQPTGFPDLGAAEFKGPDGLNMLLVESAQSVANRLEEVCWDQAVGDLVAELQGLPYVRVKLMGERGGAAGVGASVREAHRLNSPYIVAGIGADGKTFEDVLRADMQVPVRGKKEDDDESAGFGSIDLSRVARVLLKYDPSSVLHGIFMTELDGRIRLARTLSGFIEASEVERAVSGGVKMDMHNPSGPAKEGMGHVPFSRTEYVAKEIRAYFTLDLAMLRSYRLGEEPVKLLTALALWKVQQFLSQGLRLRTACDLVVADQAGLVVPGQADLPVPATADLAAAIRAGLAACRELFAAPAVTELTYTDGKGKKKAAK